MAQTGYTPILIYSSSTTTNAPSASNLTNSTLGSELAINITDGKLFYKDNAGAVQVIGWKTVPATAGGTGQTSYAVGDILYASSTTALSKLADVATGNALISGGVGVAPSYGKIGLTTHVSGTLPTANGGTNLTSFTANGVVYASSTSALATGSSFVFDGTNVGIGVASPGYKLDVRGTASTYISVQSSNASTGSGLYTANATNAYFIGAGAASGGSGLEFRDSTNAATRLTITSAGDLQFNTAGTKVLNSNGRAMLNQTGGILQVVQNTTVGSSSTTSTTAVDVTNLTVTITPSSTSSKILILASARGAYTLVAATNVTFTQTLVRTSTTLVTRGLTVASGSGGLQATGSLAVQYVDSPATTSATTYKIQHYVSSGSSTGTTDEGWIIAMEIAG